MAVVRVGTPVAGNKHDFSGFTTDTKPTEGVENGATYTELDDTTKTVVATYWFHEGTWYKF